VKLNKSLDYWDKYGEYILMATTYEDAVIAEAHGCIFKDADGNEYLDMASGQICAIVGHGHPELMRRVEEQMTKVVHTGTSFLSPPVFEAAEKLARITPGDLKKSIFLSTGAEANEYAFRIAKAYTGRDGIIAFTKGYAGLTLATISATNYGRNAHPLVPNTCHILTPDCFLCPLNLKYPECDIRCLDVSCEMIKGDLERAAAIIFEPILSAGGLIVPPPDYFKRLKQVAEEYDLLLIADEAQTGMGRTGRWFAVEHYGIVPDILVISKGIGGGFPTSAVAINEKIAKGIMGKISQFSSHQSDPLAAAAASAVIDIIEEEDLIQQANDKGVYLREKLKEVERIYPNLTNIRGYGLMVGFDLFEDPLSGRISRIMGQALEVFARKRGVHFQCVQRFRFRILPPLTITYQQIDHFVQVLRDSLEMVLSGEYDWKDLLSENRYTREMQLKSQKTLKNKLRRIWETSPQYWIEKIASIRR